MAGSGDQYMARSLDLNTAYRRRRGQIDLNYAGAIGVGDGETRFAQHVTSASLSMAADAHWNPYVEPIRVSRDRPDGGPLVSINTGAVFLIGPRLAVDAGIVLGLTEDAPAFQAGFSWDRNSSARAI